MKRRFPQPREPVTLDRAERALIVAAKLVDRYGEIYLPLFRSLEEGLAEWERENAATDRARELAKAGDLKAYREKRDAGR